MARLEKYGRKYIEKDTPFDLGLFMQNFSRDPTTKIKSIRDSDPNSKKKEKDQLTLADIPRPDPTDGTKVRTFLKNEDSED